MPEANLVGERGRGYAQFLSILDEGRIAIAALVDRAGAGLRRRVGRSTPASARRSAARSARNQAIAFKIADMEAARPRARLAYYAAAAKMLRRRAVQAEAAIAKLYALGVAVDNARDATQVHGGYGFMNEYPVGRFWRDAKILEIGEGTTEVQRMLIARDLGL